jgi:hypothetical protein
MMSDLISRKALLQKLEGKNSYSVNTATTEQIMKSDAYANCICIIEHEPTAYDVDKVVEQLKECERYIYDAVSDKDNYVIDTEKAIEIVNYGAIEKEPASAATDTSSGT